MQYIIIISLIFIENSLAIKFPYNMIALPYMTYLSHKKGKKGVFQIIVIGFLISNNGVILGWNITILLIVFYLSYLISKVASYQFLNLGYYLLLQVGICGILSYMKQPYMTMGNLLVMLLGYTVINCLFIQLSRKKIWN